MELLLAFIGAALLYSLQSSLYRRFWDSRLSVDLSFSKEAAIEGEEIALYEVITNRKLLPLPILQVKFTTSRLLVFQDMDNSKVSDNYYRNDMVSVMMFQKLTKALTLECSRRGYYTINRMDIICSDLFMTHEEVDTYDIDIHLYVYPKLVDFMRIEAAYHKMLGSILTKRFINEDPFEFCKIREYQSYDSLKSVNWKASAKTGAMKVNVHDYTSSQQVRILLNTESDTIWKYDDLNEESIRIAASLAQALISQWIPVALYTNAKDLVTHDTLEVVAGSGSNHLRRIQETLARIDLSQDPRQFLPVIREKLKDMTVQDYLIIISYYQREDLQQLILAQKHAKKDFAWIVPINHEVKITVCEALADKMIPWELQE